MKRTYIKLKDKRLIRTRAKGCCEYCQMLQDFATETFVIEHIIPLSKEGSNLLENLAYACFGCNSHKHAKLVATDPVTGKKVALFHPRKQIWKEHFKWNKDFTIILGITSVGRATIKALKMNRSQLINLRTLIFLFGDHPPKHTI